MQEGHVKKCTDALDSLCLEGETDNSELLMVCLDPQVQKDTTQIWSVCRISALAYFKELFCVLSIVAAVLLSE